MGVIDAAAAILAVLLTWALVTRTQYGRQNTQLSAQLEDTREKLDETRKQVGAVTTRATRAEAGERTAQVKIAELESLCVDREEMRSRIRASIQVRTHTQPVLLFGPRNVGKTSLLLQWHAPWEHRLTRATPEHNSVLIPLYDYKRAQSEPHFAAPDIRTDVTAHLRMRVHDFPGEVGGQAEAADEAKKETVRLKESTQRSLGIVLVCMFDASDAIKGTPGDAATEYYHARLFESLRNAAMSNEITVERIVLVYNKLDLLRKGTDYKIDDEGLLQRCRDTFAPTVRQLEGICNTQMFSHVPTVLDRSNMRHNNQGASFVFGEVARSFVEEMAGPEAADRFLRSLPEEPPSSMGPGLY